MPEQMPQDPKDRGPHTWPTQGFPEVATMLPLLQNNPELIKLLLSKIQGLGGGIDQLGKLFQGSGDASTPSGAGGVMYEMGAGGNGHSGSTGQDLIMQLIQKMLNIQLSGGRQAQQSAPPKGYQSWEDYCLSNPTDPVCRRKGLS